MSEETTTTETPEAEAPESNDAPAPETPDFTEQFQNLNARFDQLAERLPAQEQPQADDLLNFDYDDDDDEEPDYLPEPEDPRLDRLEQHIAQQEFDKRQEGLRALGNKYTDFIEKIPEIQDALDEMGITDPALRSNPKVAERAYLSLKAEAEAAAETPAEEARSRGARLETDAGASSAEEEPDPYASFIEGLGPDGETSVFD